MIEQLSGMLIEKSASSLVIDVGGVGYQVLSPSSVIARLPHPEAKVRVYIRTVVREDAITLYGFDQRRERELFDLLVTVTGVGPKLAMAILSGMSYVTLVQTICSGEAKALTVIPGLGKKSSERIILELKDKAAQIAKDAALDMATEEAPKAAQDALSALMNLGYTRVESARAIDRAMRELPKDAPLEELITRSLRHLGTS
jgi:holliday junction DNA helicase RuvA